jgi:hypothetical protein
MPPIIAVVQMSPVGTGDSSGCGSDGRAAPTANGAANNRARDDALGERLRGRDCPSKAEQN